MRYVCEVREIEVLRQTERGFWVRIVWDVEGSEGYEWEISAAELGSCYNPVYPDPNPEPTD